MIIDHPPIPFEQTVTFKKIAFHVHFLSTTFVIGMHLINPPSMDVWTLFGIIGVTLALAVLLPPRGMVSRVMRLCLDFIFMCL